MAFNKMCKFRLTLLLVVIVFANSIICKQNGKCMVRLDLSLCYSTEPANVTTWDCHESKICRKQFSISYIKQKLYSPEIVSDLLRICCGSCSNRPQVNIVTSLSEVTASVMNESDFVFPVLGRQMYSMLYGYRFLPLIEAPNIYYITHKRNNLIRGLIISCLDMWPLFVICVLMVVISGFICWVMEMWRNEDQFPKKFLLGWFEGIWWSFISMTTVGYGDKVPRSLPARLFSVIWIVVGITTFSLVTAMLTSELSAANSMPPPKVKDANVGVMRHHLYEAIVVSNQGGLIIDVERINVTDGIHKLIDMMHGDVIHGFVLDRYELMLFYNFYKDNIEYEDDIRYLRTNTILTEITPTETFSYGMLVKNEQDYDFLEDFVKSNRDVINSCNKLFLNNFSRKVLMLQEKESLFSTDGVFWPIFVSCVIVVVVISTCGAIYELRLKFCPCKWKSSDGALNRYAQNLLV